MEAYPVPQQDAVQLPLFSPLPDGLTIYQSPEETTPLNIPADGRYRLGGITYEFVDNVWRVIDYCKRETAAQLKARLDALRKVKLEIEEQNDARLLAIKHYKEQLEKVNNVLYKKGGVHKELYHSQQQNNRLRLRIKEIMAYAKQRNADYDRMQNTVDKLRTEYKCKKCGEVRHYKAFAKDPSKITGREERCNLCQRQKTESWRAAKKLLMGNG